MDLTIFRDGDRYIVGPRAQSCRSMTDGLGSASTKREAREVLAAAQAMTPEAQKAALRVYYTDDRFEEAEAAGAFGPSW